jgi:membrane fusion protein, multidrug efflux system
MLKKIILTVLGLLIVVGGLVGVKVLQFQTMFAQSAQAAAPPESVATSEVSETTISPTLDAVGSVVAVQGVTLNAEITGTIRRIAFESGASVQSGAVLVELDTSVERAQLEAATASRDLAKINLDSGRSLIDSGAIAMAQWNTLEAQAKQSEAEVARLNALIAKKTIRAPFSGKTGMRQVNLGQLVGAGDAIVALQSVDPVYVDFALPQQRMSQLSTGSKVSVTTDSVANKTFEGEVSAINPTLDAATRSVRLRATLKNPDRQLYPGMFTKVQLAMPTQEKVLLVPSTAVMFAPYGDSVYVVDNKDPKSPTAQQKFVRLGQAQGDYVVVLDGLKPSDTVVTTGAFKLRNGASIVINNELKPEPSLKPNPSDT